MSSSPFSQHFTAVLLDRLKLLFRVSRPAGWLMLPSVYFMGVADSGTYPQTLPQTLPVILYAVAVSFPICLVIFGLNDIYDYDSDMQNPRKTTPWADGTVLDQVDHQFVLLAAKVSTILILLLALPASIQSPPFLGYAVSGHILCWVYSSPPVRLKERPILDSLSNGVGFWSLWACGYTVSGNRHLAYTASGNHNNGMFVLLIACAFHSMFAVVDAKADAAAKQRTIGTVLGERLSAVFSAVCFFLATLSADGWLQIVGVSFGLLLSLVFLVVPRIASRYTQYYFAMGGLSVIVWVLKAAYDIQRGQYIK